MKRVLVLGAAGMFGSAMLKVLYCSSDEFEVYGTVRSSAVPATIAPYASEIYSSVAVEDYDRLIEVFGEVKPCVIVNCIGLLNSQISHVSLGTVLQVNSVFPHRLSEICKLTGARLIHLSTDGVFSGAKGNYKECDVADATDYYGRSKYLGEINAQNVVTVRASIIGHDFFYARGIVDWFLDQQGQCKGYRKVIFSGLPTVVLASVIRHIILFKPEMNGLYHIASDPISKYKLLGLISSVYGKDIEIIPDDEININRSLNADLFSAATSYVIPAWEEMIKIMYMSR